MTCSQEKGKYKIRVISQEWTVKIIELNKKYPKYSLNGLGLYDIRLVLKKDDF